MKGPNARLNTNLLTGASAVAIFCISVGPSPAHAQADNRIEEITVTATKREKSMQDIPMSISAISNEEIDRRGLIGMEDYLRSIPGVNQIDNGPYSNAIVIRGITTSPEFENFSSGTTVASYFDETPITAAAGMGSGGIDVRPVDIERIEILRGPQGTAYGSSSLGGAMRMIPVKPKLDGFSSKLAGSYSETSGYGSDNSMIQGVVNIPLVTDRLAIRAVGYRYEDSGFYRNIAGIDPSTIESAESYGLGDYLRGHVQDDVGRMISVGGRLAALWMPTDRLDISMNFLTQTIEQDGSPVATLGKYEQTRNPVAPQGRVRGQVGETNDSNMDLINLVLNYDLEWATVTTAVSHVDGGSVWSWAGYDDHHSTTGPSNFESFTVETRIASQLDGPLQFLGGVFYEDVTDTYNGTWYWPGTPDTNPLGTNPMLVNQERRELDQRAVFGEVSYDLSEKLVATIGGRYFKYDKNNMQLQEGGAYGIPLGEGVRRFTGNSESDTSFKANLSYEPTANSLVYLSWAEGFRLGRPNAGLPPATCDTDGDGLIDGTSQTIESTRTITSDFLENYEVGAKFQLFDRRMTIDTAVFHIKWDGLPIRTFADTCGLSYVSNVGAATSDGVEFQASLFVLDGLRLDFGGSYTNAELSEDAPGLGAEEGARLPGSPEVNANLAVQYDFEVAGYSAFVRADSFYAGKFYGSLLETPGSQAGDYVKLDARAGVAIGDLSVELFVRNLTDEDAFTWRSLGDGENPFYGYRLRPRTVGLQLGYGFE